MIFYFEKGNYEVRTYNNDTNIFADMTEIEMYKTKRHYFLLKSYEANDESLKQFALDFLNWVEELKHNDIFKFDYCKYKSHESATIEIFKKLCHGKFEDMEDIDDIEYNWIESCNNSGLLFCKPGEYNNCRGYDFSSFYPTILTSERLEIPTSKGREKTLKALDFKNLQLGFYKVKITSSDKNFNKIFSYSKQNVYPSMSLYLANQCITLHNMTVKIELIEEKNNCYVYNKENTIKGSNVFRKWSKYLFKLKGKFPKNKLIKTITSSLWGRICENNKLFKTDQEISTEKLKVSLEYNKKFDYFIKGIKFKKDGSSLYELVNIKKPYRFNIARVKPFLISNGRYMISQIALMYINDVIRICVDNVVFDQEHDDSIKKFKTYKLLKEEKTCGKLKWLNVYRAEKI
jgi:hypothetical protein